MKRSRRTSAAGWLAGLALVLYGVSQMLRGEAVTVEALLALLAGAGVAMLGSAARDADVTSEGTDARLRCREHHESDP